MNIKIGADVKRAVAGLKRVGRQSKKADKSLTKLAMGAAAVTAAYGALNAAQGLLSATFKKGAVDVAVLGDRLAKQARMVGVTAQQYQVFEFAAKRSGTSVKHVSNGLKKLGRVMVDARNGSRQIKDTFNALNIELMKNDGTLRDVNDVFLELGDRFAAMGPSAERTGSMMLLLGRSGTEMANMMAEGSKGITDMEDVLKDLGAIMGDEILRDSESFVDMQADLEHSMRGLAIGVGKNLIPALTDAGDRLTEFISKVDPDDVADIALSFLNWAENVVLLADSFLNLGVAQSQGMGRGEESLRNQSRALEDLMNRLKRGESTTEDFALAWEKDLSGSVLNAGDSLDALISRTMTMEGVGRQAAGGIVYLGAKQGELNEKLIEGVRNYKSMGVEGIDLKQKLVSLHGATSEQVLQLDLFFDAETRLLSTEKDLAKMYKERSQATDDLTARGEALRRNIAGVADERKKSVNGQVADLKKLLALLDRLGVSVMSAEEKLTDTFLKNIQSTMMLMNQLALAGHEQTERIVELQLRLMEKYNEDMLALTKKGLDKKSELEGEQKEKTKKGAEEEYITALNFASKLTDATSEMFNSLGEIAMVAYEKGDKNAKQHAMVLFGISKAAAIATAIVNTAVAISEALKYPIPLNAIAAAAAGAAGAAQVATIVGTSIQGIGDAGITSDTLKKAGLNNHSAIVMRNDETLLDPVGTKHITEMLAMQRAQMQGGGGERSIRTTVELDGRVLGESVDNYLIRQQERGLAYGNRVRQEYV